MMRAVYVLFAIVVVGTALGGMTQTALNTMAPVVLADLSTNISWGQWLTTVYMLSMGVAVPLASFLVKRFSTRNLLLASFLLYLAGSACDCLAVNFPMLLVGRVLDAVATGVLMPLLQTIAMTRFPEHRHGTAMGIAGIALGFAPNVGPTVGGALAQMAGWRALFFILVAASVVLLVLTCALVKREQPANAQAKLEWPSLALSATGFGGLLLGFTDAANYPLAHPLVWAPAIVGAVLVVLFLRRQARVEQPLVNLAIFEERSYRVCLAAQCCLYGCFLGMTLIIPLFVIDACGMTSADAGLVLLPGAVVALVFEPGAGAASDRFGPRKVALFGGVFLTAGAVGMAFIPTDSPLWLVAAAQVLRAVGFTTLIPTTTSWGLAPLGRRGITTDGSSFFIMSRQIAAAVATAVMVLLIAQFAGGPAEAGMLLPESEALGYHLALGFSGVLGAAVLLIAAVFIRDPRRIS